MAHNNLYAKHQASPEDLIQDATRLTEALKQTSTHRESNKGGIDESNRGETSRVK